MRCTTKATFVTLLIGTLSWLLKELDGFGLWTLENQVVWRAAVVTLTSCVAEASSSATPSKPSSTIEFALQVGYGGDKLTDFVVTILSFELVLFSEEIVTLHR